MRSRPSQRHFAARSRTDRRSAEPSTFTNMAAPPHLDAIPESPLGCSLLGSPVFDAHEEHPFALFKARIAAADTAYELAVEESRQERRAEARRGASRAAAARRDKRDAAQCARRTLEDAIAEVSHLLGDLPDLIDDGLTPRSSLRRACDDAAVFLAEEAAEPVLPSPGPMETGDQSPPRTRTSVRTEEYSDDCSDAEPTPAPAEDNYDDWSSSAEAPAPAPLDDDDELSIVSVSSATAEDASDRLARAEDYAERYPNKAAAVLRPCITAWRGGAPVEYSEAACVGPVLAVSCCYLYARCVANVAVQDGAAGENSPSLVADALEALDQALELDPSHAPSLRLRARLIPLLGEALMHQTPDIRASFRPQDE